MKKQKKRAGAVLAAAALALALVVPAGAEAASTQTTKVEGTGTTTKNASNSTVTGNVDEDTPLEPAEIDVQGKVTGGSEIVYDLDIKYGAMQFEYDYGSTWNPATHKYTPGASGNQDGGWVIADHVDGTNNKIHVTNNSNFPMTATFSYTPGTSLNANATAAGAVTGIFSLENDTINIPTVLAQGKGGTGIAAMETVPMTLEMDISHLTDPGTYTYYYKTKEGGDYEDDMFFALSGKPDAGGPDTYTSVGSISVAIAPCSGTTAATKTVVNPGP